MRLQASSTEDKKVFRDLQQALKTDNASIVLARHSDTQLLRLLRHHARYTTWLMVLVLIGAAIIVGQQLLFYFGPAKSPANRVTLLLIIPGCILVQRSKLKPATQKAIEARLRTATLATLLDAYFLGIPALNNVILEEIVKHLTRTTTDELEALSIWRRRQLVLFTLAQFRPQQVGSFDLAETQVQAATLGYLALATLKEPGAERPDRRGLNEKHINLREAIVVYLTALRG